MGAAVLGRVTKFAHLSQSSCRQVPGFAYDLARRKGQRTTCDQHGRLLKVYRRAYCSSIRRSSPLLRLGRRAPILLAWNRFGGIGYDFVLDA